jgi:hypothetical protein
MTCFTVVLVFALCNVLCCVFARAGFSKCLSGRHGRGQRSSVCTLAVFPACVVVFQPSCCICTERTLPRQRPGVRSVRVAQARANASPRCAALVMVYCWQQVGRGYLHCNIFAVPTAYSTVQVCFVAVDCLMCCVAPHMHAPISTASACSLSLTLAAQAWPLMQQGPMQSAVCPMRCQ